MSNQISIPFKRTASIPIGSAVREYIYAYHRETHPDAFKWDIERWEELRTEATADVVHVSRVQSFVKCDLSILLCFVSLMHLCRADTTRS